MSLVTDKNRRTEVTTYGNLEISADKEVKRTIEWMNNLQKLNASLSDAGEKTECAALRQKFRDDMTVALGL